jgi:Dolichyl-phosphate-mannose-protein mannosyltransferase
MEHLKNLSLHFEKNKKTIVFTFFLIYFLSGCLIYRDYGLAVDDVPQKLLGEQSYDYIFHGNSDLLSSRDKDHGAAFELTITYLYKVLGLHTDAQIYYFRHLVGFISFFIGTIFFFLLVKIRFQDWKIGLMGTLFLILSPRIFESSFVNSKDIPFMAFSIISLYTLFKLDEKMRFRDAVVHGAITGYLIAIRPLGLLMVAMTGVIWLIRSVMEIKNHKRTIGRYLALLGVFLGFTILFIYMWWPWLWVDPIRNFISAFLSLSQYTIWRGQVLYMGSVYEPTQLPWHYTPVWILVTTPLLYTFYFIIGIFFSIKRLILTRCNLSELSNRFDLVILGWFIIPLVMVYALHSALYSGWRHMFFIYPAMLVMTIGGILCFFNSIKNSFNCRFPVTILKATLIMSLIGTITSMITNHPYEGLYFTIFAGKNLKSANYRYGLDFYGLCTKEALDYLVKYSGNDHIKVFPSTALIIRNTYLLPMEDRSRIEWTDEYDAADYYFGVELDQRAPFIIPEGYEPFYSVTKGKVDLCVIYRNK